MIVEWLIKKLALNRCHRMDFMLQLLLYLWLITVWPISFCKSGSMQKHVKLCSFCYMYHFIHIHLNLHSTADIMITCTCKSWDSLPNCSATLAVIVFKIFCSQNAPIFLTTHLIVSSGAVSDTSRWFCWQISRDNWHNAALLPLTFHQRVFLPQFSHHPWTSQD